MIEKAIEKISEEMKSGDHMVVTLGKYVKSELLTSDTNAVKILALNTDLETFVERLRSVASEMNKSEPAKTAAKFSKKIISIIKGIKPEEAEENAEIGTLFLEAAKEHGNSSVCLSSELVIPLLHIYYGISSETVQESETKPKRSGFRAVSLD